ncbi:MAG: SCO family protein [Gammaproteobacteria bacterium]|nr:SCO family protein [Gammaproteobacteria bacterium]
MFSVLKRPAIVLAMLLLVTACDNGSDLSQLRATVLPPRPPAPFALVDHNGTVFDNQRLVGHWTLMFFGYTNCPDVCPTTLQTLKQVSALLPEAERPQVVFVSVDPGRDTPELLNKYVTYFNPRFLGVTGELQAISDFTRDLGVMFRHDPPKQRGGMYTVDHSAGLLLFNPDGQWRAYFAAPHKAEEIAREFRVIRAAG